MLDRSELLEKLIVFRIRDDGFIQLIIAAVMLFDLFAKLGSAISDVAWNFQVIVGTLGWGRVAQRRAISPT